jgi:hypothetical protein
LRPIAVLGGVAAMALLPVSASAFQTVVGGKTYEVSTFTGSYSANSSRFTVAEMPWFGNQSQATEFAAAVGAGLGLNPGIILPGIGRAGVGPLFASAKDVAVVLGEVPIPVTRNSLYYQVGPTTTGTYPFGTLPPLPIPQSGSASALLPYAVAREISTQSVPAPLPLVGAGAAFGFSRRVRSRIRRSTTA